MDVAHIMTNSRLILELVYDFFHSTQPMVFAAPWLRTIPHTLHGTDLGSIYETMRDQGVVMVPRVMSIVRVRTDKKGF